MEFWKAPKKSKFNIISTFVSWWSRAIEIGHSGGFLQQTATLADWRPANFRCVGYVQNLVSTNSLEILREHLDHKWQLTLSREGYEPSSSLSQTTALRLDQWSNRSEISCTYLPGICKNSLEIFRFLFLSLAQKLWYLLKFLWKDLNINLKIVGIYQVFWQSNFSRKSLECIK